MRDWSADMCSSDLIAMPITDPQCATPRSARHPAMAWPSAHLVIGVDVVKLQYAVSIDDMHRWYRQHVVGLAGCLFQIDAAEAIAGDQRIIDGIADAECADRRGAGVGHQGVIELVLAQCLLQLRRLVGADRDQLVDRKRTRLNTSH